MRSEVGRPRVATCGSVDLHEWPARQAKQRGTYRVEHADAFDEKLPLQRLDLLLSEPLERPQQLSHLAQRAVVVRVVLARVGIEGSEDGGKEVEVRAGWEDADHVLLDVRERD